jgi:hypothetical protein
MDRWVKTKNYGRRGDGVMIIYGELKPFGKNGVYIIVPEDG